MNFSCLIIGSKVICLLKDITKVTEEQNSVLNYIIAHICNKYIFLSIRTKHRSVRD